MSATDAKKAELLLYNGRDAMTRLVEIVMQVINTGEQPKLPTDIFGGNYFTRASIRGDFHFLYLDENDRLFVICNDMGGEPPWTTVANKDVSFIYLWMLKDEGLRDETEILTPLLFFRALIDPAILS